MYRVYPKLRTCILSDSTGINEAVKLSWTSFEPGMGADWTTQGDWLHIMSGRLPVHFNLLTSELLVNGLPLARLPQEYRLHSLYTPLFQQSVLEVVPTEEPGMSFSAKSPYQGFKLHFGMLDKDMLLMAVNDLVK